RARALLAAAGRGEERYKGDRLHRGYLPEPDPPAGAAAAEPSPEPAAGAAPPAPPAAAPVSEPAAPPAAPPAPPAAPPPAAPPAPAAAPAASVMIFCRHLVMSVETSVTFLVSSSLALASLSPPAFICS